MNESFNELIEANLVNKNYTLTPIFVTLIIYFLT